MPPDALGYEAAKDMERGGKASWTVDVMQQRRGIAPVVVPEQGNKACHCATALGSPGCGGGARPARGVVLIERMIRP